MKTDKIIFLLLLGLIFITVSAVAAGDADEASADTIKESDNVLSSQIEDTPKLSTDSTGVSADERTFTATGETIGYDYDSSYGCKFSKKAKKQLEKIKQENRKNPTTYTITISEKQYKKLLNGKNKGKCTEIQIKTDKYIKIKIPVIKTSKKTIFSKKYYKEVKFNKALKKLKNKYYLNDDYKIKVKTHWKRSKDTSMGTISIIDYKQIIVVKKYRTVKSLKTSKDRITASVVVNDYQQDGKDWVYFFAPKLGIDGTMAQAHISIG